MDILVNTCINMLIVLFAVRKGPSRDKPPTPRVHSEDHISTSINSTVGNTNGSSVGGGRGKRQSVSQNHHSNMREGGVGGRHSSSRSSGGGGVQMRARDEQERERRDGCEGEGRVGGRGHTNRHSWDPETATQYHSSNSSSISSSRTMTDKVERLQSSVRYDNKTSSPTTTTTTTGTNNRFERLNPDTEAPGDQSSTRPTITGSTRGRKRNSRSVSGSSSAYRSRSPKQKSGKEGRGSGHRPHSERGGNVRERENAVSNINCELEWDSNFISSQSQQDDEYNMPSSQTKDVHITETSGGCVVDTLCGVRQDGRQSSDHVVSSLDKMSGASAQGVESGGDGVVCGDSCEGGGGDVVPSEGCDEVKEEDSNLCNKAKTSFRLAYTRVSDVCVCVCGGGGFVFRIYNSKYLFAGGVASNETFFTQSKET